MSLMHIIDFGFSELPAQQAKNFLKNSWKNSGSLSKMAPSDSWRRESGSIAAECMKMVAAADYFNKHSPNRSSLMQMTVRNKDLWQKKI